MLDDEEVKMAREMFALAQRLSGSEAVLARRAGQRIAVILNDLLFENDPLGGLPAGEAIEGRQR